MLIRVMYADGRYDFVNHALLNQLIDAQKITRFHRSEGWIDLAIGPLRRNQNIGFRVPERRVSQQTCFDDLLEDGNRVSIHTVRGNNISRHRAEGES